MVSYRWRRMREKTGITNLKIHDLRHEALSRMAEKGLHIGELKAQSGHKTAQTLLRYVNAVPANIAQKLG
jgi:integrase